MPHTHRQLSALEAEDTQNSSRDSTCSFSICSRCRPSIRPGCFPPGSDCHHLIMRFAHTKKYLMVRWLCSAIRWKKEWQTRGLDRKKCRVSTDTCSAQRCKKICFSKFCQVLELCTRGLACQAAWGQHHQALYSASCCEKSAL